MVPKTVVYTQTKDYACKVYGLLCASTHTRKGVGLYHAAMSKSNKLITHQQFSTSNSSIRCLVATIAYGLVYLYSSAQCCIIMVYSIV